MSEAAGNTQDPRMKLLAAANVGMTANNAVDAVKAGQGTTIAGKEGQIPVVDNAGKDLPSRDANAADKMGGVGINLSLGGSKSSSKTTQTSNTAAASNLTAGRDITITASGAGEASDLTIQGAKVSAARNLTLSADDEINLLAAANTSDQKSTNQNSSASVGIGFMVGGTQNGFTIQAGVSGGQGKANGNDLAWTNTQLAAGKTLTLESGGDTTLRGAVAKGEQVIAKVEGDLRIESLQDTSTYDSKQKSLGVSVSLCIPPFCYGATSSGSVSASGSKVKSDYASVTEQSGLRAGDGGFQVAVKGDTDLKGGAITSTQQAINDNKNSFQTDGTLTTSDIQNKAEYTANSASINVGTGFSAAGALTPGGTSAGFGKDGDKASSTTLASISGVAGNKDARTGDAETGIKPIFDQTKVQKEIDAQVAITQMFGQLASKAVGDYATTKLNEAKTLRDQAGKETDPGRILQLQTQATELENQWGDQGTLRIAAHTLIGGLTGGASGAAGAAAGTITAPLVATALADAGVDANLGKVITALASTAVGAVVGGTAGASTALNEVANNFLSHPENEARLKAARACADGDNNACKTRDDWDALDKKRDTDLRTACYSNGNSANCSVKYAEMKIALESYAGKSDATFGKDAGMGLDKYTATAEKESFKNVINVPHYDAKAIAMATEVLKVMGNLALDLTPIVGDVKAFAEANTKFEYALAMIGALGPLGDGAKVLIKEAKVLYEAGDIVKAAEKVAEAEKTIVASAGKTGAWDKVINGKLEPQTTYKLDNGHAYVTDASGRVKGVEADLSGIRSDRNGYQQACVGKCGDVGDEGGHLIAASLGGAGDRINIVPQASTLNRGDWKSMEAMLKKEIDAGKSVSLKIDVGYPAEGGVRPNLFAVVATIDGKVMPPKYFNQ